MNEKASARSWVVKVLVIVGFLATIVLFLWFGAKMIALLSPSFANLASVTETMREYGPVNDLELQADKDIVNSGESFRASWNDTQQTGEFIFSYECVDGVTVLVRDENERFVPIRCTETLTLPATVHGLFLSIDSRQLRFADVMLNLTFISSEEQITLVDTTQVTVINASVVGDVTNTDGETPEDAIPDAAQSTTTETGDAAPPPQPQDTPVSPPQSSPNGYVDLAVTILGVGEVRNNAFQVTAGLNGDGPNALKFDIENTGTKTSDTWRFFVDLPGGTTFRSDVQAPLRPQEHAVIVLTFELEDIDSDSAQVSVEAEVSEDITLTNNRALWYANVY